MKPITSLDIAEDIVSALSSDEEYYLLVAILKSLSIARVIKAANEIGYNLEAQ